MRYYRKKPLIVSAVKLRVDNLEIVESWCGGSIKGTKLPRKDRVIDLHTLDGEKRAEIGDFIVKGTGEFYPVKPDVFDENYEVTNV